MNFPLSITNVLISLNWATAEEDYISGVFGPSPELTHSHSSQCFRHPIYQKAKSNQNAKGTV
jgi:hypothetical protein